MSSLVVKEKGLLQSVNGDEVKNLKFLSRSINGSYFLVIVDIKIRKALLCGRVDRKSNQVEEVDLDTIYELIDF